MGQSREGMLFREGGPIGLKEETMSNIYELLKRAEEDKEARGESEEMPIVEIGDLEIKKTDLFPGFATEEILAVSKEHGSPDGENVSLSPSCLAEMVQDIKKALASLVRTALLGVEKANDVEFTSHSRAGMMKDYKKIDLGAENATELHQDESTDCEERYHSHHP